jgi:Domain of unknown function (DUF5060)
MFSKQTKKKNTHNTTRTVTTMPSSTIQLLSMTLMMASLLLLAEEATSQAITSFRLVNAQTNTEIGPLNNNAVLFLNTLPSAWTIIAISTGLVGSVAFNLDGNANYRTENAAPWSMTGDNAGAYIPWNPVPLGGHTLIATPFTGTNRGGTMGTSLQVSFTVNATNGTPTASDVKPYNFSTTGALSGELRKWHKITLGFVGPFVSETDTYNPFTNYLLNATFTHSASGTSSLVPGYFAADGNAANSGASSGNVWLCHFAPDKTGQWNWAVSFRTGTNVSRVVFAFALTVKIGKTT